MIKRFKYYFPSQIIEDRSNHKKYYGNKQVVDLLNRLNEKNKSLEKQVYLIHMSSMFSTVKAFKGDVSKRYKYSEETDTIYDTANHYGQYDKVLDKKEITMLLNEYETILKEFENDKNTRVD